MTRRQEFSKQVRRDAFMRSGGRCEFCGQKLLPGNIEYHHTREAYLGGEATMDNCVVLCRKCHAGETKARRAAIDKTRRLSDKRMGIRPKSKFAGARDSRFKKKLNGEVVVR